MLNRKSPNSRPIVDRTFGSVFGAALLAALFLCAGVGAQPQARRATTIAAIRAYPGFYHQQTVLVVGEVKGTVERATIGTEEGAIQLVARELPRDSKIEATLAEFFTAGDERDTLIAQLALVENTIRHTVQSLFDLGENAGRVADLLDLDPKEVKRLRGLTTPRTIAEPVPSP